MLLVQGVAQVMHSGHTALLPAHPPQRRCCRLRPCRRAWPSRRRRPVLSRRTPTRRWPMRGPRLAGGGWWGWCRNAADVHTSTAVFMLQCVAQPCSSSRSHSCNAMRYLPPPHPMTETPPPTSARAPSPRSPTCPRPGAPSPSRRPPRRTCSKGGICHPASPRAGPPSPMWMPPPPSAGGHYGGMMQLHTPRMLHNKCTAQPRYVTGCAAYRVLQAAWTSPGRSKCCCPIGEAACQSKSQ